MDEIKQQKIKLNEDERNSTNNKNENDELNNILSVINRIYQFFEYKFLPGEQPDETKTEPLSDEDRSGIKQPTQLKQLNLNEISKPLWIETFRDDFISLIKDVVNNLDDKDQITVNKHKYELKNAEKYLLEIIIKKISKNEALKLYNSLIKPDIDALKQTEGKGKNKRNNILNILNNIESSFFEGLSFHYKDKSLETEENIAEKTKLRRRRLDEIAKKEKKVSLELFKTYFDYSSLSNMYKALNETKSLEENRLQVNTIENKLTNLIDVIKSSPTSHTQKN